MNTFSAFGHTENEVNDMERERIVQELNQLLKGTHMGASIFEDLRGKLESEMLHKEFHDFLQTFHLHEKSLTALIEAYGGEPLDTAGVMGTITDVISHIKNMAIGSDKAVLDTAYDNMQSALQAIRDFDTKNYMPDKQIEKTVGIMKADYASILHKLEKYRIEFA